MQKIKDAKINVFNIWWWLYIVFIFVLIISIYLIGNNLSIDGKYKLLLVFNIIEYIGLRIYKFSLKNAKGFNYNYFNELTCYLCNQANLLSIIACLTRSISMMSYCVIVGSFGAFLALLMPDEYFCNHQALSLPSYGFYGYHSLLFASCLSFFTLGLYKPELSHFYYGPLWLLILTIIAHIINFILRKTKLHPNANYTYTYYPENFILKKLYAKIPIRFVYLLPLLPIFALYSFIMILILRLF